MNLHILGGAVKEVGSWFRVRNGGGGDDSDN